MPEPLPTTYKAIKEGQRYRVPHVPIFAETKQVASDGQSYDFGPGWISAAVEFAAKEAESKKYFAPIHLVHHGRVAAPVRVGDLENLSVEDAVFDEPVGLDEAGRVLTEKKIKRTVFADLVFDDLEKLTLASSFPHRSVEIYDARIPQINSLALLGAEEPHIRFPNLRFDLPTKPEPVIQLEARAPRLSATWTRAPLVFERSSMPPETKSAAPAVKNEVSAAPAESPELSKGTDGKDATDKKPDSDGDMPPYAKMLHQTMMAHHSAIMAALGSLGSGSVAGGPGLAGAAQGTVSPVAMERSPEGAARLAKLEAENAVLKDALNQSAKRLSVSDAVATLEREGYAVGQATRAHFESLAARGDSLDVAIGIVRSNAPKLPKPTSEASAIFEAKDKPDSPEVVKLAPKADSPERRTAREWWGQYQAIRQTGALAGVTFERFVSINTRPTYAPQIGK